MIKSEVMVCRCGIDASNMMPADLPRKPTNSYLVGDLLKLILIVFLTSGCRFSLVRPVLATTMEMSFLG